MTQTYALWACLLLASASFATKTYRVQTGDTLGHIAIRHNVTQADLVQANPGLERDRLKIDQVLSIPAARKQTPVVVPPNVHVVQPGENSYSIAARYHMSNARLLELNPGVEWTRLRIGQHLKVQRGATATVAQTKSPFPVAAAPKTVTVQSGENDWIIARRVGIRVAELHALNPDVNWTRLQIGAKLRVPGVARPQPVAIRTKRAKVNVASVIVRTAPSTTAGKRATLALGEIGSIVNRDGNGWFQLKFRNEVTGWVRGDLLMPVRAADVANQVRRTTYAVSSRERNQRNAPRPTTKFSGGTYVASNSASTGHSLLDKAQQFLGVRYRYGGTTSRGFDCSGFVSSVFSSQGVKLPRTSAEQSGVGKAVSKSDLNKGDLVFFATRGRRVSHVGIYMGNGKFIHASSGGGKVKVDSLNDGYYARRYAGARRPVKLSAKASKPDADELRVTQKAHAESEDEQKQPIEQPKRVSVGADEISR